MWIRSLGWEDPLEEGMATHSNVLAWRIPWTEELVGYSHKELNTTEVTQQACTHLNYIYIWMLIPNKVTS